jgi:hypothetical protein
VHPGGRHNVVEFFTMRMGDPWAAKAINNLGLLDFESRDRIYDLMELLYREAVSVRTDPDTPSTPVDKAEGQARFREIVNPILRRCDPPLELTVDGDIVQEVVEPFRRLVEQSLPDDAPKREASDRVDDAVAHFRRRGATPGDRRAAVRELADVLEFLRPDVKEHLLSEDERVFFHLANEFAIRHNKRETRRDFDDPAWLAWAFYVYLATIRLVLELRRRAA